MSFSGNVIKEIAQKCLDYDPEDQFGFGDACEAPPSIQQDIEEFNILIGCEFDFHGEQSSMVRLNNIVYEFLADPDDGYRSHLGAVMCTPASEHTGFFPNPVARVLLVSTDDQTSWPAEWTPPEPDEYSDGPFHGYFLLDADDYHVWYQIGTEYHDAYYPCFVSRYAPKINLNV
jgi:hypothetical protein